MKSIESRLLKGLETSRILYQMDNVWTDHLQKMSFLKDTNEWISLGSYDPLKEYKNIASEYYYELISKIKHLIIYYRNNSKSFPSNNNFIKNN